MIQTVENSSAPTKLCPSFTLSTTNATWTGLGLNPFPSKTLVPTSNHPCHGTARQRKTQQCVKGMYQLNIMKHVNVESG